MTSFPTTYLFKPLSEAAVARKKARKVCVKWGCRRPAEDAQRRLICLTCHSRLKRLRHDDRYAYDNLKASARKRGVAFELSFDDFLEFCAVTGYLEQRGKDPHSLSIDRIENDRPYCMGNIRIMNYHDNVSHRYERRS